CGLICIFFFFSSRRRHTRFSRDWSSDVCSSDLGVETIFGQWLVAAEEGVVEAAGAGEVTGTKAWLDGGNDLRSGRIVANHVELRSEERRVGKEGRSRGGPDRCDKKKMDVCCERG